VKATDLLKQQHREVEALLKRALKADDADERRALCGEIKRALQLHSSLEEEIFYPAFRQEADTKKAAKLVLEAYEEHHVVDLLLNELPDADPQAESFEAKLTVLQELVDDHVEEEEEEMFPAAERAFGKDRSEELAEEMRARADEGGNGGYEEREAVDDEEMEEADEAR